MASARDLGRLQSEKDALEEQGVLLSQQMESVKVRLHSSQGEETRLRLELEAVATEAEQCKARSSGFEDENVRLEDSTAALRERVTALELENEELRKQAQSQPPAVTLHGGVPPSGEPLHRNVENLPPQHRAEPHLAVPLPPPAPTRLPQHSDHSGKSSAEATADNSSLSSSYLINRIHLLQAKLDRGFDE